MKTLILAAGAAFALASAPAAAEDFTGPRVGATVGVAGDDVLSTDDETYGINAGYDLAVGDLIIGATLEYQDSFDDGFLEGGREIAATVRAGTKIADDAMIYATGGYSNLATGLGFDLSGYRLGAGAEIAVAGPVSVMVEQRYTDYGSGVDGFQTVLGLNFRF